MLIAQLYYLILVIKNFFNFIKIKVNNFFKNWILNKTTFRILFFIIPIIIYSVIEINYNITSCSPKGSSKSFNIFKYGVEHTSKNFNNNSNLIKHCIQGKIIYSYYLCDFVVEKMYEKITLNNYNVFSFSVNKYVDIIGNKYNYTHTFSHFIAEINEMQNICNNVRVGVQFTADKSLPNFGKLGNRLLNGEKGDQFISYHVIFYNIDFLKKVPLSGDMVINSNIFLQDNINIKKMNEIVNNGLNFSYIKNNFFRIW